LLGFLYLGAKPREVSGQNGGGNQISFFHDSTHPLFYFEATLYYNMLPELNGRACQEFLFRGGDCGGCLGHHPSRRSEKIVFFQL
jgi:hypothetical protein